MHNSSIAVSRSIPEAFWKDIKPVIPNVNLEKYKYIPFTRLRKDERPGTAAAIKASIGLILPSIFRAIISEKGSWQGSVVRLKKKTLTWPDSPGLLMRSSGTLCYLFPEVGECCVRGFSRDVEHLFYSQTQGPLMLAVREAVEE